MGCAEQVEDSQWAGLTWPDRVSEAMLAAAVPLTSLAAAAHFRGMGEGP